MTRIQRAATLLGFAIVFASYGYDTLAVTPQQLERNAQLIRDQRNIDPIARDRALVDLNTSLRLGLLTDEQRDAVVTDALAAQADPNRQWSVAWGIFVEEARRRGYL